MVWCGVPMVRYNVRYDAEEALKCNASLFYIQILHWLFLISVDCRLTVVCAWGIFDGSTTTLTRVSVKSSSSEAVRATRTTLKPLTDARMHVTTDDRSCIMLRF